MTGDSASGFRTVDFLVVLLVVVMGGCASLGGVQSRPEEPTASVEQSDTDTAVTDTVVSVPEANLLQHAGLRVAFPAEWKAYGPGERLAGTAFLLIDHTVSGKRVRFDRLVLDVEVDPERMANLVSDELASPTNESEETPPLTERTFNGQPYQLLRSRSGSVALYVDGNTVWIIEIRSANGVFTDRDFEEFVSILGGLSFAAPDRSLREIEDSILFVGLDGWRWTGDHPEGFSLARRSNANLENQDWPRAARLTVETRLRPPIELSQAQTLPASVRFETGYAGVSPEGDWTFLLESGDRRLVISLNGTGAIPSVEALLRIPAVNALLSSCVPLWETETPS